MRRLGLTILGAVLPLSVAAEVVVNTFAGRTYHHVTVNLGADAMRPGSGDLAYSFSEGGMFEIYIHPELVGVAHPACSKLTVRMPWTNETRDGAEAKVAGKRALFNRIEAVRAGKTDLVEAVLELDPYLEVADGSMRLTQCTVFFRHAFGGYVGHARALSD